MREIKVADAVYSQVSLLAMAWDITESEVVRRLLEEFQRARQPQDEAPPEDGVPVHAVYEGVQTEGVYLRGSKRLRITTGVLAGRTFKSPSGAAIEVVRTQNPAVEPNRNGWKFWKVSATGRYLEALRPGGGSS